MARPQLRAAGKQKKPRSVVPNKSRAQKALPSTEQWASDKQRSQSVALPAGTFEQTRASLSHTSAPQASL